MAAGDGSEGVHPGEHREAKCERHADEADAELRKGRSQYCAPAASEDEPECAQELSGSLRVHDALPVTAERTRQRGGSLLPGGSDCHSCALPRGWASRWRWV